eukprot:7413258-Pyramimonas_sp.AAC.1
MTLTIRAESRRRTPEHIGIPSQSNRNTTSRGLRYQWGSPETSGAPSGANDIKTPYHPDADRPLKPLGDWSRSERKTGARE